MVTGSRFTRSVGDRSSSTLAARQQENNDALILLHNTFKEGGDYANLQEFVANRTLIIDKRINTLNDTINALIESLPQGTGPSDTPHAPPGGRSRSARPVNTRFSPAQARRLNTSSYRARSKAPSLSTTYDFGSQNRIPSLPKTPAPLHGQNTEEPPNPSEDFNFYDDPISRDLTRPSSPAPIEANGPAPESKDQLEDEVKEFEAAEEIARAKPTFGSLLKSWADAVEDEEMQVDKDRVDEDNRSMLSYGFSDPEIEPHEAFHERTRNAFFERRGPIPTKSNAINASGQAKAQENQDKAKDTWVQVARRNANRKLAQAPQNTPPAPPGKGKERDSRVQGFDAQQPNTSSPMVINAPEYKIFHINFSNPIDPSLRLHSQRMFSRIAAISQDKWKLNCLEVKWTKNGSITLRFPAATHDDALKFHQMNILRTLNHRDADATFTQQHRWSRVTIYNVPCITEDEDGESAFVEPETLTNQLSSNFLFKRLNITETPRWIDVLEQLPPDASTARFGFGFEDPFGDLARDLCGNGFIFIQGTRCPIKVLKNKVFVGQCTRCWRLGQSHINCQPRCRLCGGSHPRPYTRTRA